MLRTKKALIGLSGVAVIGAAAFFITQSDDVNAPAEENASKATHKPKQPTRLQADASGRSDCTWPADARLAYDADSTTKAELDVTPLVTAIAPQQAGGSQPKQKVEIDLEWRVELRAVGKMDGDQILAGAITRVSQRHNNMPAVDERLEAATELPFLIRMSPSCAIEDMARRSTADKSAAHLQQSLVNSLQWRYAEQPDQARYAHTEISPEGMLEVRYVVTRTGGVQRVLRRIAGAKQVFEDDKGSGTVGETSMKYEGRGATITPGDGPWFDTLSREETRRVFLGVGKPLAVIHEEATAKASEPIEAPALAGAIDVESDEWIWGWLFEEMPSNPLQSTGRGDKNLAKLAAMGLPDALKNYAAMIESDDANIGQWIGFLSAWIQAHPDKIDELLAALKTDGLIPKEYGHSGVFAALGKANIPAARAALMGVLESGDWDAGYRTMAASALTNMQELPEGYLDALAKMSASDDPALRSSGKLVMGVVANEQRSVNPEVAKQAREHVVRQLDSAEDPASIREALAAASNTADPELLPQIEKHLAAEDPVERKAAADAMRLMPPAETAGVFADRMTNESDSGVRREVVRAMTTQATMHDEVPDSVVAAAIEALATEQDPQVVGELIKLVGAAARRGDAAAQRALDERFAQEMQRSPQNTELLRVLGLFASANAVQ